MKCSCNTADKWKELFDKKRIKLIFVPSIALKCNQTIKYSKNHNFEMVNNKN